MAKIFVKLLGIPNVFIDNHKVRFPFRQVEALFYYIFINGEASREELMELLWPEEDEDTARKNLRNALYNMKKYFPGCDIIQSFGRNVISLNKDIKIDSDINNMELEVAESDEAGAYDFLQGFSVRNSEMFEEWTASKKEFYKELQVKSLLEFSQKCIFQGEYLKAINCCRRIIIMDEYNEEAYRFLMKIYYLQGSTSKALETYCKLKKKLQEELSIIPDSSTEGLAEDILKSRIENANSNRSQEDVIFYGRTTELRSMDSLYRSFISDKDFKNILISGEAGIGKSYLKDRFLQGVNPSEIRILNAQCYQAEEKYVLKPWNNIISAIAELVKSDGLEVPNIWTTIISHIWPSIRKDNSRVDVRLTERVDTFTFQVVEEAVVEVLQTAASRKRILIVFEDIQWMDEFSLSLLKNLILNSRCSSIFFILTCRAYEGSSIGDTLVSLLRYKKLHSIVLERLTPKEVEEFMTLALPEIKIDSSMKNKINEETEGNTFFVAEYVNSLKSGIALKIDSSRMKDLMKSRLMEVSQEGRKLMNLCSVFFSDVSLEILKNISGESELSLLEHLEELQEKNILKEVERELSIQYRFTHQKLREFIYNELSLGRRKILHIKAAQAYESMLNNDSSDIEIYPKLIYHYELAGDSLHLLKYSIALASRFLDFNHELFPVMQRPEAEGFKAENMSNSNIDSFFHQLEKLLQKSRKVGSSGDESAVLEMEFLHLRGRYFIREGQYEKGTKDVLKLIKLAEDLGSNSYILKGCRQMIYYFIQINDADSMSDYIHRALALAESSGNEEELAVLLRLKGLNSILLGRFADGEQHLAESIRILESMDQEDGRHEVSIAAALNYMGDIRKNLQEYHEALSYYKKAIAICEDKSVLTGAALFKTNAAVAAYKLNRFSEAFKYIKDALEIYERSGYSWGRSIAEAYAALLLLREERYVEAAEHLDKSSYFSKRLQNPMHISMVRDIEKELYKTRESNPKLKDVLENIYLSNKEQ